MSMADQVILLRAGRIEHAGTPVDLYTRPATLFTARFIGASPMNLLDLADGAGGAVLAGGDGSALLPGPGEGRTLGLRPEDLSIRAADSPGIAATVTGLEYLGADTLVSCNAGTQAISVRHLGAAAPEPGTPVSLGFEPAAIHLFDRASGRRIEPSRS
jgi:sn-glycerol 3-phosphate transport system ATP-binding protein